MITLVLVAAIVSASLIGTVSFAAPTETHGAISVAFDDCRQSQYDYAFPLMQARGIKATFYVVTDAISDFSNSSAFMSIAELQTLQDYGCEIASHSKTHASFTDISDSQIREECNVSKQVLQSYGFSADNFAYPYGSRNNHTDSIVAEYYRSARSAYAPAYIMQLPTSQFLLPGGPGETGDPSVLSYLESGVDEVDSSNGWAIVFFHNIIPDANNTPYTISSQDFESFLDYIIYKGVPTITVNQGLDLTSPPSPPPSVTISPTSVRMHIGQSQTFSSSVTDGNPPFSYQWYLNDTAVSGATSSTWAFTPATTGHYKVYLNVIDGLNFKAQSNIVTDIIVYPQLTVSISPVSVNMTVGGSQTFSSTVSGGAPPYSYQWYQNDTAVSGATGSTWTFTPRTSGHYVIYLNVTDGFSFRVKSNVVDVSVYSVYLLLTVEPGQGTYVRGQSVIFTVNVFNQLNPVLGSSLTLTVTGPSNYGYFDVQPISVPAGTVGEYSFGWVVPDVAGTYVVEVELVPLQLTAYDVAWLTAA